MYFSNYDYYDEKMQYIRHSNQKFLKPSFQNALVECICPGMCMVINRSLRDNMVKNRMKKVMYHDWMAYLIATAMGKVIYDEEVTIQYRRHTKNVSNINQNFFKFQLWRMKQIVKNEYFKQVKEQLIEFESLFGEKLKEEDKALLSLFTKEKYHFGNALKKAGYPHAFRQKMLDDILIRGLFLIGVL